MSLETANTCDEILEQFVRTLSPDNDIPNFSVEKLCDWMPDNHKFFSGELRKRPTHTFFEDTGNNSYLHEVFRRLRACCDAVDGYEVELITPVETGGYTVEIKEPDAIQIKRLHLLFEDSARLAREILYERILSTDGLQPDQPEAQKALDKTYSFNTIPPDVESVIFDTADLLRPPDVERTKEDYRQASKIQANLIDSIQQGTLNSIFHKQARERIVTIHAFWKYCLNNRRDGADALKHPLAPIVKTWVDDQRFRTWDTATVDHINKTYACPYVISEINRNHWIDEGDINSVSVDGEPLANIIKQLPPTDENRTLTILRPRRASNKRMQGVLFKTEREPPILPIALVAYRELGHDLRSSDAQDTALLLKLVYACNQPLRITTEEGAQLLARDRKGKFRRLRQSDVTRFGNAYINARGLYVWLVDGTGYSTPFEVVKAERPNLETGVFLIEQPDWWKRAEGHWTLSGGLNPHRLAGHAENKLGRYLDGIEFWLTRSSYSTSGKHKGIAKTLQPDGNKTTGGGEWIPLDWRKCLILGGDNWDKNDTNADNAARQRWNRLKDLLIKHGYTVRGKSQRSISGDTIEFIIGHGGCWVRATSRFTEAAWKARKNEWDSIELKTFLKMP